MRLMKAVDVEDARIKALTPEAFRLVLEARGWSEDPDFPPPGPVLVKRGRFIRLSELPDGNAALLALLAAVHHNGSTFDAFIEVERVQALLSAVEAAERGEWQPPVFHDARCVEVRRGDSGVVVWADGAVRVTGVLDNALLWGCPMTTAEDDPERAAREARAQLPRLVRIICGVEG